MDEDLLQDILRGLRATDPDGQRWPPTELERRAFAAIVNSYGPIVADAYWNGDWS